MKKRIFISIFLVVFVLSSVTCLALTETQKKEYGLLQSAATFSSDKIIGEYGDTIPDDFDKDKFLIVVKDKIPDDYYNALTKHRIDVTPMKTYYLLKVYDSNSLILFDYSCTSEVDGPILLEPEKYDLNHLELYDKCK
jgi:hypothetical protein